MKLNGGAIVEAFVMDCLISCKEPYNVWSVKSDIPIKIEAIIKEKDIIYAQGRRLLDLNSFFQEPLNSCELETFLMKDIQHKFLCSPFDTYFVIIPTLHACLQNNDAQHAGKLNFFFPQQGNFSVATNIMGII